MERDRHVGIRLASTDLGPDDRKMQIDAIRSDTLESMRLRPTSTRHVRVTAEGTEPARCCLRDALPGESLLLTSFAPPMPDSPYAEVGAVFIHADAADCTPVPHRFPEMSDRRRQVLRAYDRRGWIHDYAIADPGQSAERAAALLTDPAVAFVDVRNPGPGCYMFRVRRSGPPNAEHTG